jgi:multisubunit Na+/H+ antiporter MnhE subunit
MRPVGNVWGGGRGYTGGMGRERAVAVTAAWITLAAIEVLLVGKIDPQETPVGIAVAALAACATAGVLAVADKHYTVPLAAIAQLPRVAAEVVRDTFVVTGALVRVLRGAAPNDALEEVPFASAADAALGALTIAGASAAPNSIVVDVDPARRTMLVHRLTR